MVSEDDLKNLSNFLKNNPHPTWGTNVPVETDEERKRNYLRLVDQRCAFLTSENRCWLHEQGGLSSKPKVCRDFPFRQVASPDGLFTSVCFSCHSCVESVSDNSPKMQGSIPVEQKYIRPYTDISESGYIRFVEESGLLLTGNTMSLDQTMVELSTLALRHSKVPAVRSAQERYSHIEILKSLIEELSVISHRFGLLSAKALRVLGWNEVGVFPPPTARLALLYDLYWSRLDESDAQLVRRSIKHLLWGRHYTTSISLTTGVNLILIFYALVKFTACMDAAEKGVPIARKILVNAFVTTERGISHIEKRPVFWQAAIRIIERCGSAFAPAIVGEG